MILILCIIGLPCLATTIAWYYYNRGLSRSGHVCRAIVLGERYTPQILNIANLFCPECHDIIPSEVKIIYSSRNKEEPFRAEIAYEDLRSHQVTKHGKNDIPVV
jgi:hypothetical protein